MWGERRLIGGVGIKTVNISYTKKVTIVYPTSTATVPGSTTYKTVTVSGGVLLGDDTADIENPG